jgi:hypothetical protein
LKTDHHTRDGNGKSNRKEDDASWALKLSFVSQAQFPYNLYSLGRREREGKLFLAIHRYSAKVI